MLKTQHAQYDKRTTYHAQVIMPLLTDRLQATTRRRFGCVILTVAVLAAVVTTQEPEGSEKQASWSLTTTKNRALFEERQYVQMPPQHRLLPARKSFLAVCAIVKVGFVDK